MTDGRCFGDGDSIWFSQEIFDNVKALVPAASGRKSFFAVRVFACTSEELDAIEQKYRDAGAIGPAPKMVFSS